MHSVVNCKFWVYGAEAQNRTGDTMIFSRKMQKTGGDTTAENYLKNSNNQIVVSKCPVG